MANALIVIAQNDANQVPGSRDDLILNTPVQLSNQDNTGVVSYLWQIIDQPSGSTAVLSSSLSPAPTFTPDIEGTYLIRLIVNAGISTDQQGAAVKTINLHYRIPAASEQGEFDSIRGWAGAADDAFNKLDDGYGNLLTLIEEGGGSGVSITSSTLTLSPSPLLGTGTINLSTLFSSGSYTNANITVDTHGRITSAASGSSGSSNTFSSRFTNVSNFVDLAVSGVSAGSYGSASQTPAFSVDSYGQIVSSANTNILITESQVSNLTTDLGNRALTTTSINTSSRLTGGGNLSANRTLDLATSGVSAGLYTNSNLTVDSYGRITAASNGSGATTLQQAYNTSAGVVPSIQLTSDLGAITIFDRSSSGSTMFQTANNDGSIPYITMDSNSLNVNAIGGVISANYQLTYNGIDTINNTTFQIGSQNSHGGTIGRSGFGTMEWTEDHTSITSPDTNHSVYVNYQGVQIDGYVFNPAGAINGQALVYNGTAYIPTTIAAGGIGGSIANTQIAYGDGINIAGSNNLTYDGYDLSINGNIEIPSSAAILLNGTDTNWKLGINLGYTKTLINGNSIDIKVGDGTSPVDGFSIGNVNGSSIFELRGDGQTAYFSGNVGIGYAPSYALDVNGTIHSSGDIVGTDSVEITSGYLLLGDDSGSAISDANTSRIRFSAADGYTSLSNNGGSYSQIQTFANNPIKQTANVVELELTTTTATNVLNIAAPITGNYLISLYYRVATITSLTIQLSWTDVGGSESLVLINGSQLTGAHTTQQTFISVVSSGIITLTATATNANAVFVSANALMV